MPAVCRPLLLVTVLLAAATAEAADGLRQPDAAAVWPAWQLRLSRPQDPVGAWRHEAWWGGASPARLSTAATTRLSPQSSMPRLAVAQSSL